MRVTLSDESKKQFFKLNKIELSKITKKLLLLEESPFSGKKLKGQFEGKRSLKAWPYRIIYVVTDNGVIIISISHRQDAYK